MISTEAQSKEAEAERLNLEHTKLSQEKELREKELALKERELELQREQNLRTKWSTPAVVAIVAGLVGYVGTLISNYQNRQLERDKQEGTLILEAIKTAGTAEEKEKLTATNLVFLADAGLITSIKKDALDKLRAKAGSAVPSLPAAQGIDFKRSPLLTAELQSKLQAVLADYQSYLNKIGYDPGQVKDRVAVRVDEEDSDNAYFDNENIVLGPNLAKDPEYVVQEYSWYVLKQSNPEAFKVLWNTTSPQFNGFAHGLKFYFACSYLDNPYIGKNYHALVGKTGSGQNLEYLFNLKEFKTFDKGDLNLTPHKLGEIWAGAFWELREKFTREKADRLLLKAWKQFRPVAGELSKPNYYVDTIIGANESSDDETDSQVIRQAFERRKLN